MILIEQFRFYLFREVPFGNDGDFSKDAIANRLNADLSNNYGNLVQRITTFCVKNCNYDSSYRYCTGCFRSGEEITNWIYFSEENRKKIMKSLPERRKILGNNYL